MQKTILLLLISILALAFNVQPVSASETIYIRPDGSVDPSTAPIQQDGDVYTFTNDITYPAYDGIVVQKSNIVIDGNLYLAYAQTKGFDLTSVNNVTIINTNIIAHDSGIWLESSSFITIYGNEITNCHSGVVLESSDYNDLSGNIITDNFEVGVGLENSFLNTVSGNIITNNVNFPVLLDSSDYNDISGNTIVDNNLVGVYLLYSCFNTVSGNTIANTDYDGVRLLESDNNLFYHNNFINNNEWQVNDIGPFFGLDYSVNTWDAGYPSGGNYWSDYTGVDLYSGAYQNEPGSDGIGDTSYVTTPYGNNADNYPFMGLWPHDVTIRAHCITEGLDVSVSIDMDGSPTPHTTPHIFTGLIATHTFTVPSTDPNGHPFIQWNTDETSTTITVTTGGTYTAHYGTHDVAVTNVMPSETVVVQGDSVSIDVTVENQAVLPETFGVVAPYFDGVVIPTSEQWKTFWGMGDVNRDGYINLIDVSLIQDAYISTPGDPNWNPDADLNQDLYVGSSDLFILQPNLGLNIWTYFGLPVPPTGTQRGVKLYPGNQTTLTFTWDTTGVALGDYTITAKATTVPGETDTDDNTHIDGVVTITAPPTPVGGIAELPDVAQPSLETADSSSGSSSPPYAAIAGAAAAAGLALTAGGWYARRRLLR